MPVQLVTAFAAVHSTPHQFKYIQSQRQNEIDKQRKTLVLFKNDPKYRACAYKDRHIDKQQPSLLRQKQLSWLSGFYVVVKRDLRHARDIVTRQTAVQYKRDRVELCIIAVFLFSSEIA